MSPSGFTRNTTVNCHACGAPIIWAERFGEKIPLDSNESLSGPERYVIVNWQPAKAVAAGQFSNVPAHTDHRTTCPVGR